RRKTRAFEKIEYRDGVGPVALARLAGSGQILAALFWILGQVLLAEALHEGKLQRPPAQANDWHPDELLLEKKLQDRHTSVQLILEHQDAGPALVIAGDKVRVVHIHLVQPLHIPFSSPYLIHPETVDRHPGLSDPVHSETQCALNSR